MRKGIVLFLIFGFYFAYSQKQKFSADKRKIIIPESVQFTSLDQNAASYEWTFGDGMKSNEKNPLHRFVKSGIHTVHLKTIKGKKIKQSHMQIEVSPSTKCLVQIETEFGTMLAHLYDETPLHRDNFLKLADQGFFNELLFHRVISGFMIQGGDPTSKNADAGTQIGSGGPGYTIPAEFSKNLIHKKGALAAARTGDAANPEKKSSGSQFYIVQGTVQTESGLNRMEDQKGITYTDSQKNLYLQTGGTPFLDGDYTVFGEILEGFEILDKIAATPTGRGDRPVKDVKMKITSLH
ncbi:MAG: peptidylprolyl isomerase [Bacteroidota bacterium]|nr:peptidylprolyl isomerase [Bacteroidota bacterium]